MCSLFSPEVIAFFVLYGLYAFFKVNRSKPVAWMVANIVWLVGMAAMALFMPHLYMVAGVVAAVASVGVALFQQKLPLMSNLLTYGKMVVKNLLFFPVEVFEEAYGYLSSKL